MPRQFETRPPLRLAATPTRQRLIDQSSGVAGVKQTLAMMAGLKHQFKTNPTVRELALSLIARLPQKDYDGEVRACCEFVKFNIRYVRDVAGVETVQTPVKTLEYAAGDCDDKSTLLGAMLESIGHPCRFKAVAVGGGQLCHVYPETLIGKKWVALETTEPEKMGWQPPDITSEVYDSDDGTAPGAVPELGGFFSKMNDFSHGMAKRHLHDISHPFDLKGHLSTTAQSIKANPALQKVMKIKGLSTILSVVAWVFPPLGAAMTYITLAMNVADAALALDARINKAKASKLPYLSNGMSIKDAEKLVAEYNKSIDEAMEKARRITDIDRAVDLAIYSSGLALSAGAFYIVYHYEKTG